MGNFWFAFDWKEYEDDTVDLSLVQHGAYLQLLIHYYKHGEALPNDTLRLARISHAHSQEELEAVSEVLKRYFVLRPDGWHNKRADEELSKMRRISNLRSKAARSKSTSKCSAIAPATAPASTQQLNPQLTTNNIQKAESKAKAASAFELPPWIPKSEWDAFEEMRRKIRKPMTDRARALVVAELFKLRAKGCDPTKVLEQSIRNSWQDVYELKDVQHGQDRQVTQPIRQPSAVVARYHNNRAERERTFGAAVGGHARTNGDLEAPRLGAGNPLVLDGEAGKV